MGSIGPISSPLASKPRLKTIDWGSNGVMISLDQRGTILQLGFYHPKHGVILVSPFEQFDGDKFYDPSYVRSYRARMMEWIKDGKNGYGLRIGDNKLENDCFPEISRHRDHLTLTYQTSSGIQVQTIITITDRHHFQQTTVLSTTSKTAIQTTVALDLGMSLNRASYGQLTEGGPIPLPELLNVFTTTSVNNTFSLKNPNLGVGINGHVWTNRWDTEALKFEDTLTVAYGEPVTYQRNADKLVVSADLPVILNFTMELPIYASQPSFSLSLQMPTSRAWYIRDSAALTIIQGNLEYILGNCMIPISENSTCIITDHVALPLGWNRDNYWQVRFLLDAYDKLDSTADPKTAEMYKRQIYSGVKAHLNWIFRVAQRPHCFWHRSYIASGVPKDGPIFQLDQQCYPIIELCDFFEYTKTKNETISFVEGILLKDDTISEIIDILLARRDTSTNLFPTDETPGDDPVEYPYHFSSHVLVWYTFTRLAKLVGVLGDRKDLETSRLKHLVDETHAATMKHFAGYNPVAEKKMFAYLTDGADKHAFYHDANDIPTLFAQEWGFVNNDTDTEITESGTSLWMQTMKFGLSPANKGGYYDEGPFGGLGSVHTRGPWPLGYFQEVVFAEMTGDLIARQRAWEKIKGVMFFDGLFSEAVDNYTGECTSKAWFAWPGSMIGSALLWDRKGIVMNGLIKG